jgi:septum formation protein
MPSESPLILASASPRRKELLQQIGVRFEVFSTHVPELDERASRHLSSAEFTWCNALRKALAAAQKFPRRVILAADTTVALGKQRLGKPANLTEAAAYLRRLSGKTHQVYTSVIVLEPGKPLRGLTEISYVRFKKLSAPMIQKYITCVDVFDKAGAYALQQKGGMVVADVRGLTSNVIGLPIERLPKLLPKSFLGMHKKLIINIL